MGHIAVHFKCIAFQWRANWEMEQPGRDVPSLQDAGVACGSFAHCAAVLGPIYYIFSCWIKSSVVIRLPWVRKQSPRLL